MTSGNYFCNYWSSISMSAGMYKIRGILSCGVNNAFLEPYKFRRENNDRIKVSTYTTNRKMDKDMIIFQIQGKWAFQWGEHGFVLVQLYS